MFKQVISRTQLTTDTANDFFRYINGQVYQGDVSFVSTLRALVAPRMKEDELIFLSFYQTNDSLRTLTEMSAKQAVKYVSEDLQYLNPGSIVIHNFYNNSQDTNRAWMDTVESTFTTVYPEWHRLEKVTDFFKKSFYTLCFINPDEKRVIIYVENMDIRKMHYLQCSIFAFLPWYFDPRLGVSKLEMELIESLRGKDAKIYEDCIAKIAEQYDFRTARIRKLLAGFETKYVSLECDRVRRDIQDCIDNINSLNSQIGDYLKYKNDYEIRLLGLENKIANSSEESEIMDYFLCNDRLILGNVGSSTMVFTVKAYLEYFDEDLAERVINNDNSYIYKPNGRNCNNIIPAEDMRMLMTAIFIEQRLKIKLCAAYEFRLTGTVRALGNYVFDVECRDCTPNPHIDRFTCLGNYSRAINELLSHHDYIGAIEQCSASCKSLNFNDSPVMCEFMRRMYGISEYQGSINMRCIELPDGSVATPIDAIQWLKLQQGGDTNE